MYNKASLRCLHGLVCVQTKANRVAVWAVPEIHPVQIGYLYMVKASWQLRPSPPFAYTLPWLLNSLWTIDIARTTTALLWGNDCAQPIRRFVKQGMNLTFVLFKNFLSSGKTFSRWGQLRPLKFQTPSRKRQNALHWDLIPLVTGLEDPPPSNFQPPLSLFLRKNIINVGCGRPWLKVDETGHSLLCIEKRIISPL